MMTPAAATDPHPTLTTTTKPYPIRSNIYPVRVTAPSFPPPLTDPSNRGAAADPTPDVARGHNHHHAHSSHVTKPQANQVSPGGKRVAGEICCGVRLWHAAAFPPPLPRFSPITKRPPHHLDPLPVPRVPFMSQVCQLAIVITPAAALQMRMWPQVIVRQLPGVIHQLATILVSPWQMIFLVLRTTQHGL